MRYGDVVDVRGRMFRAIDWFPHVNRNGAATIVIRWVGTCDRCPAEVAATSASGAKVIWPYRCERCRREG